VSGIRLKLRIHVLIFFIIHEGCEPQFVSIILVDIPDCQSIPSLLQIIFWQYDEISCGSNGETTYGVDNYRLDSTCEINLQSFEISIFKIEGDFSETKVLLGVDDDADVVGDTVFS